jgi:hypothetical protein
VARNVLPIIGQAIGSYFGGPWGAAIGSMIGTAVGNAVDPLVIDGPKIGDVAQQTSSEGVYQPIYFGTIQGAGNIIAQGPNVIRRRRESQGKGGGPVTVIETLYKTFAIRIGVSWLGEQGITGVSRIWENGKLVFDNRPESTIPAESAQFATKFRIYLGTDTQAPDPALEAIYGVGNTPSYRGRAYIVFPLYDITQWKAIPQYSFEVVAGGIRTQPIQIVALRGTNDIGTQDWLFSPDGLDFSGSWTPDPALPGRNRWMIASRNAYNAYSQGVVPATLGIGQDEWAIASGAANTGTGGNKVAAVDNTGLNILIPQSGDSFLLSQDGGSSWQTVGSTPLSIDSCGAFAFFFVGTNLSSQIFISINFGAGWSFVDDFFSVFRRDRSRGCRCYSATKVVFGGNTATFPVRPALVETTTTVNAWEFTELAGGEDGTHLVCLVASQILNPTDSVTYIAISNDGKLWRKHGDFASWVSTSEVFPFLVKDGCHNGQRFYVIGDTDDEDRQGFIMSSPTGEEGTWVIERNDSIPSTETWNQISALAVSAGTITEDPPYLDQVVSYIHTLCQQPANEYDVSDLSDILVRGLVLAGAYTGKDSINTMQQLWMIDSPEYDKKIHYRLRGANVVDQLTFDDLIDEPEDATREQAIEYPKKLHLDYQSPVVDYAPAKATSSRSSIDARVIGEMGIQVPVVLTADEAFQRAAVLHKVSWTDADGEVVFSVPDQYLGLVPGDCISLFLRGNVRRLRIDKLEYFPGRIKLTCRGDRQSAYTSNVEGLTPPPSTPPPPSIVGPTMLIVGDWPALRDQDDQSVPVKYIAMGGITEAWRGALGEQSLDGGNSYSEIVEVFSGAIMGTLQDDVSEAAPYFADHTNKVIVQLDLDDFEIDSLTESQFLSENGGFALVKPDNTFEIMQYRDALDMGDGLYELSYLQRGRLDSETHAFSAGDRFVLLNTVAVVPASTAQIGMDVYHRATSFGQTTEDGTVVHDVYEGNSQREWPVANILLDRSGDTITGTIVPRHRFGTEISPVRSINWTNYEVTFQDSLDQFETITQVSDTISYDASAMTFPVTVTVYQVNRITGAGPGKSEVIE